MTFDSILHALRTAELPPVSELEAARSHADALAPLVYERLEQFSRAICLLPEDESLLFYGLHVLAAARHPDLWQHLVTLARTPPDELDGLLANHAPQSLAQLMLSVWDGDTDALLRLIEHADMGDEAKWALFDVLARATFDGRIPRETTVAFLERFEHASLADDDSPVWWGWENAVARLGLVELEPALRRAWTKPAYAAIPDDERSATLETLLHAAASPNDPTPLEADGIERIDDLPKALEWVVERTALHEQWKRDAGPEPDHLAADPARQIRLTPAEYTWLARFLVSRQVDPTALTLPMLDGFLTAAVIGPGALAPEKYLPMIWGEQSGSEHGKVEPHWSDEAQRQHVMTLIERLRDSIVQRAAAGAEHTPLIASFAVPMAAAAWGEGFALGMELLDEKAWDPLFANIRGAEDGLAILALCPGETGYFEREATDAEKESIVERLPRILQRICAFWRAPGKSYPGGTPVGVQKIGRNDQCPCGSGQKYKKCCALKPPPSLN